MAPVKTASKVASKKPASHPTFLAMIQECIKAHPEDARAGVSRPTIKKFLAETYKLDMSSKSNINHISSAITRGEETGALSLPNGPSGRVKLTPKAKSTANKENVAPAPKKAAAPAKKPAAPKAAAPKAAAKPAAKKPTTAAKPAAKKAAAKPAAKKTSSAKKPAAAKAAAKPAAKKAAAPKKAAAKK